MMLCATLTMWWYRHHEQFHFTVKWTKCTLFFTVSSWHASLYFRLKKKEKSCCTQISAKRLIIKEWRKVDCKLDCWGWMDGKSTFLSSNSTTWDFFSQFCYVRAPLRKSCFLPWSHFNKPHQHSPKYLLILSSKSHFSLSCNGISSVILCSCC